MIGLICALAVAWNIRAIEAYAQLRDTAWDYHSEWTERWADLRGTQPQTDLLKALRADAAADNAVAAVSSPFDIRWKEDVAIVLHPGVEDIARIDAERFEIVQ